MTAGEEPTVAQVVKRAEGWLYLIAARRLRGPFPHKRYFVLEGGVASCYRTKPGETEQVPIRKGVIDPYTRVTDNGRETIHGQVLFVFTIYDSTDSENQLKFGARSAEEAAKWMTAFKAAAEQAQPKGKNGAFVPSHGKRRLPFRKRGGSGLISYPSSGLDSLHAEEAAAVPDWTGALSFKDGSPDVVATSPWRIIGCKNGLRLFMETTDHPGFGLKNVLFKEDQPALMSVGVVNAPCEAIFETAMALGPSRHEWDFCYLRGKVIEHIDGHTDIIHKQFHSNWMPWRMKPRDLVLLRYWRREDDGSYVILYRSVKHDKCPPRHGFVRAKVKSGGYVIAPIGGQGPQCRSLVRHMITADWKVWQTCFHPSLEQDVTLRVLQRIAAIREVYKARPAGAMFGSHRGASNSLKSLQDAASSNGNTLQTRKADVVTSLSQKCEDGLHSQESSGTAGSTFLQLGEGDEFYDVQEDASWWDAADDYCGTLRQSKEAEGTLDDDMKLKSPKVPKLSAAATIVKRLHELANTVQKKSQAESALNEIEAETLSKEGSLPKGSEAIPSSCWDAADEGTFLIRGKKYLQDNLKMNAGEPSMQFIAADWLKSDKREDHLASRPSNLVQILSTRFEKNSTRGGRVPFFFIVNLQVPGATTHSLSLYYMTFKPLEDDPLLEKFVHGDDRFRNSRFKLIPHIAKGSWIVKQSVGKTACLIGQALTMTYHTGSNYIELDVDIGSSSVAKGVVNLVIGYLSKLVIEMAFLIQAETEEELPERLLGTCRLSYLDITKAVSVSAD